MVSRTASSAKRALLAAAGSLSGPRSGLESALRFSLRISVSALAAFSLVQIVKVPLHGLWAVLTAVIVTQASVGGSIRASLDYVVGTLAGAVYASLVSLLIPHDMPLAMAGVLVLSIAPLAFAAARSSIFRVAPFTAVIVLLLAGELGEGPITAASTRLLEVALGGMVAVGVSLLIFPERAFARAKQTAIRALQGFAHALPVLLEGFSSITDADSWQRMQGELGAAVASFDSAVSEARHEQLFGMAAGPSAGPLSRTLLRLRHDLVIIGRAAATHPLAQALRPTLSPCISAIAAAVSTYLAASARALRSGPPLPDPAPMDGAMQAFNSGVAELRAAGTLRSLATHELEQLFALLFALEQLRRNLSDLERCVRDWTRA